MPPKWHNVFDVWRWKGENDDMGMDGEGLGGWIEIVMECMEQCMEHNHYILVANVAMHALIPFPLAL